MSAVTFRRTRRGAHKEESLLFSSINQSINTSDDSYSTGLTFFDE
jgi:hypothetical protein